MKARNNGARDQGKDDRREGVQRVMADNRLEGEEYTGNWRVERRRDRRGDTAAQQRRRLGADQPQPMGDRRG